VWAREYFVPWVLRRLRHQSSGDEVTAKRPDPQPVIAFSPPQREAPPVGDPAVAPDEEG
jgi:hypothetical protein